MVIFIQNDMNIQRWEELERNIKIVSKLLISEPLGMMFLKCSGKNYKRNVLRKSDRFESKRPNFGLSWTFPRPRFQSPSLGTLFSIQKPSAFRAFPTKVL